MNFVTSQSTPFEIFKAFFDGVSKNLHNDEEIQNLLKKSGISLFAKSHATMVKVGTDQEKTMFCSIVSFETVGKIADPQIIRVADDEESFIAIASGIPTKVTDKSNVADFVATEVANKIRDIVKLMYVAEAASSK